MAFDIIGAKNAGYSDTEIADYLSSQNGFDAAGARKAGYSDQEIIGHVSGSVDVGAEAPKPPRIFSTPSKGTQQDVMGIASPKDRQAAETAQVFVKNDIPAVAKTFGAKRGGGMEQSIGGAMRAYGEENTNRFNVDDSQLAQTRAGRYLNDLTAADDAQRAAIAQRGTDLGNEGRAVIQAAQEDQPVQTRAGRILDQTAQSIGSNLPGMAATMVTGSPAVGLSMMGLQSFGQTYDESRAKGLNIADATMNAAIQGGTEVATEMLPFVALSKYLKTDHLSKEVLKHYLSDIPGEHLATAIQNASDAAYDTADMTPQQRIDAAAGYLASNKHKEDQIDTFFTTVLQGAVMGGVAKVARAGNALAPEAQPAVQPAPSGPLSRAVGMADTRAVVLVQSIGSLVAERRGLAQQPAQVAQPVAEQPAPEVAPSEPVISRAAAPVQGIGGLVAERRKLAETQGNPDAQIPLVAGLSEPVDTSVSPENSPIPPTIGVSNETADEGRQDDRQYTQGTESNADGEGHGQDEAALQTVQREETTAEGETGVATAAAPSDERVKHPWEMSSQEYAEQATPSPLPHDVFYVHGVEVIQNPTSSDYSQLKKEAKERFPNNRDANIRFTEDAKGNRFIWKAYDAVHSQIEPSVSARIGRPVSQNPPEFSKHEHRREVYRALQDNQTVPEEVLAEYKDDEVLGPLITAKSPSVVEANTDSKAEAPEPIAPAEPDFALILSNLEKQTAVEKGKGNRGNWSVSDFQEYLKQSYPTVAGMPKVRILSALRTQAKGKPLSPVNQEVIDAFRHDEEALRQKYGTIDQVAQEIADEIDAEDYDSAADFFDAIIAKNEGRTDEARNAAEDNGEIEALFTGGTERDTQESQREAEATDDAGGWQQEVAVSAAKKVPTIGGVQKQGGRRQSTSDLMDAFTPEAPSLFSTNEKETPADLTLERVQSSFPSLSVTEDNGTFTVTTPSGIPIRISKVGEIEFGPEQRAAAEKEYGRPLRPDERPAAEYKPLDHGALINLTDKGVGELDHEAFHAAMSLALTPKQQVAVLRTFGNEEKAAAEYQRLKESGALETRKGNYWLSKIYRFLRALRQLISPTAKGVMEDVASGKVWGKAHKGDGGARYAFARADQIMTPEQKAAVEAAFGTPPTMLDRAKAFKKDLGKNLVQGVLDQYAPIKDIDMGAYMKARMTKGADSTLEAVMLYGKPYIDSTGSIRVEFDSKNEAMNGFATILAELDGEHDRFLKWVAGIRAARLKDIGLENLMSKDTIKALKSLNRDGTAENKLPNGEDRAHTYMRVLNHMNAYNDAILKVAVERGLINDSTRRMYKDMPYIPFYRLQDEGVVSGFTVTSGLVNQTAWKKLKGGTNKLNDDMLANMLKNWSHLITASARNEAAAKTLTKALELGAAHEVPAGYPGKGIVSFRENTTTVLKKDQSGEYKRVQGEPLPAGTKYKEGGVDKVSDGTMVPEFNVERHFIVTDPHLLDAITSIGQVTKVPKPLRAFKNILAHSVTINPTFKIRNLIRDSISSIALADLSYNPAKNIAKGYKLTAKDSETRAQMLASGGIMRFGSMLDGANADNARKLIDAGVPTDHILDSPNKVAAVWKKYVVGAFDAYQEFGDRGEQVNRAALYQSLLDKGYTPDEAAFWARDLMDFSMSGKWASVRFLSQTVPFMNARLQGMYKLGRSAKADKKRFGYVIGGVALASLALLGAYHDDDDWQKREAWDRDNYWWFKIGDKAFRIPKPFEIGAIGSVAEWSAELMFNREMTGKKFAVRMRDIISSQLSMNPTPQIVKPLIDLWANKDSFTQRPIEGMGMDRLKPEDRFNDKTSGVAKLLGQLGMPNPAQVIMGRYEGLSPVQIDFMIRGYFSWLGVMATTTLDYGIFKPLSGTTAPAMQLKDTFMVGNFVESLPSNSSRYVSEMYDNAKEIEQSYNSYRNAIKSGDRKRAAEIMVKDRENIQKHGQVERLKETVADLNRQIKRITASSQYSADQKRTMIDKLKQRQSQIAKTAMQRQIATTD